MGGLRVCVFLALLATHGAAQLDVSPSLTTVATPSHPQRKAAPNLPGPPPVPPLSFQITLIARSGDEPPERPGESFTFFSDPTVNATGRVAFKGTFDGPLSGNEGIYVFEPSTQQFVRLVDDSFSFNPPGQSGATSWTSFGAPVINDDGRVAFHGNFSFGDNSQGLYIHSNNSVGLVFDDNPLQAVPGQPSAVGFTTFPMGAGVLPVLSANHVGATEASWFDAGFVQRSGLYTGTVAGGIVRVADVTQVPPGQGAAARFSSFDLFMTISNGGDVVFHAPYTGGQGGHGIYRYRRETSSLLRVADASQQPPGQAGSASFTVLDSFPAVNASGTVAFGASYSGGLGTRGLYLGNGVGPLVRVVDDSGVFSVPDNPGKFFNGFGFPVLGASGQVLFSAQFGAASDGGLFHWMDGTLSKVFDFGDEVPDQPGASFFALGSVALNLSGQAVFAARYSGGIGDEGIYFWDGSTLHKVLDESDMPGGVTLTNLHMMLGVGGSGGRDGKPNTLSDAGHVAFRASLGGGHEAVFLASPR